jgi:hypothetical protein
MKVRRAGGEQRDAEAGDMLGQAEQHGEPGMEEPEQSAGERRHHNAAPQRQAEPHRHPAGHGAGGKNPFNAEIEHAGALADERAQHAEDQRRGDADRRGPEAHREQDLKDVHGLDPARKGGGR